MKLTLMGMFWALGIVTAICAIGAFLPGDVFDVIPVIDGS